MFTSHTMLLEPKNTVLEVRLLIDDADGNGAGQRLSNQT